MKKVSLSLLAIAFAVFAQSSAYADETLLQGAGLAQPVPTSGSPSSAGAVGAGQAEVPNLFIGGGQVSGPLFGDFSTVDTDGDGILDTADNDDDNDGSSDADEAAAGTNPLDNGDRPRY